MVWETGDEREEGSQGVKERGIRKGPRKVIRGEEGRIHLGDER